MKLSTLAITSLAAVATAAVTSFAADELPKAPAFARYEPMMNRSPFAVATAPVALPAATPNFAKDLYIANAARTADGDLVTIASSTDKNFKKYLSTKAPVDGYSVPSIEWSDRVGATKVTISKDGQFATLTFNQALLSQPVGNSPQVVSQAGVPPIQQIPQQAVPQANIPQSGPAAAQGMQPQQFPVPANAKQPGGAVTGAVPALPTPPPRTRGVIQRNPTGSVVPTPAQPAGQALLQDE